MSFQDINWSMAIAGLGLFLFGISLMGDGLKSLAGDKLRDYIDKYTSSPVNLRIISIPVVKFPHWSEPPICNVTP